MGSAVQGFVVFYKSFPPNTSPTRPSVRRETALGGFS